MIDADVLANTPNFQGKPYGWWRYFRWKGRILRNFRLRMHAPKGIPSGDAWWRPFRWKGPTRADIAQLLIAHACILPPPLRVTWPSVASGSHGTCTTVLHFVLCTGCSCARDHFRFQSGLLPVTWLESLPVLWLPVRAASGSTTSNTTL